MLPMKELKKEAEEYQKVSTIRDEVKETIVEAFADVMKHEDSRPFFLYSEAIYDLLHSVVSENYKGVVYSVGVKNNHEDLEITLNFVYGRCEREFILAEYDFKDFKEAREEDEEDQDEED